MPVRVCLAVGGVFVEGLARGMGVGAGVGAEGVCWTLSELGSPADGIRRSARGLRRLRQPYVGRQAGT